MKKTVSLIIVALILAMSFSACGKKAETSADTGSDYIEEHGGEIIAAARSSLDIYYNGFKMSLDPKDWTLKKYDDHDTVIAVSEVTYHGSTGPYIYVGTLELDDAGKVISATHHYIEADGAVLLDDGYCKNASEILESLSGN